jgi:hypothetical protein
VGALNLGVRFLLELALVGSLAWWGLTLDGPLLVGVGAPALALIVWGRWIAPRAKGRLEDPLRFGIETVLWIAGAGALAQVWSVAWAVAFLVLALVTAVLVRIWPEPVHGPRR